MKRKNFIIAIVAMFGFLLTANYSAVGQLGGGGPSTGSGSSLTPLGGVMGIPDLSPEAAPPGSYEPITYVIPCMGDCPNIKWIYPVLDTFTLPNGCKVRVIYTWRINCDNKPEVQILEIITNKDDKCSNYSKSDLFRDAHRAVIMYDRMNWFKTYPCIEGYRISLGSCWVTWYVIEGNVRIENTISCNAATCCKKDALVCKNGANQFIIQDMNSSIEISNICGNTPKPANVPTGTKCQAVCDSFKLSQAQIPKIQEEIDKPNENEFSNNEFNNSIEVKVLDNILYFNVLNLNEEETEIKIFVVDYYGNEVVNIVKKLDFFHNAIQTKQLNKGNYYYNIYIDGKILHSSNVIIE